MRFIAERSTDDHLVDRAVYHLGMFILYQRGDDDKGLGALKYGFNRVKDGKCQAALYDYYTSVAPDPKKAAMYPFPSGITPPGDSFGSIADYGSSSDSDSDSDQESTDTTGTTESYSSDRDGDGDKERPIVRRPIKRKMCSSTTHQKNQSKIKKIGEN